MPIDPDVLLNWPFAEIRQTYDDQTAILYALGLGIGHDPVDGSQLDYVYERGLKIVPTLSTTLGFPGPWLNNPATGVTYAKVVHGEQHCEFLRPLPPRASVVSTNRVEQVLDKGPDKGALIVTAREIRDQGTNALLARHRSVVMARGDGGFGGPSDGDLPRLGLVPEWEADMEVAWPTYGGQALIYRLSGDLNPLHADPEAAQRASVGRPILHGLSTFGAAAFAAVRELCGGDPDRLLRFGARFSAPVYPGETLVFAFWRGAEGEATFTARVAERDTQVLTGGAAAWRA